MAGNGTAQQSASSPELSQEDKEAIFRLATRSLRTRYADQIETGMTDDEIEEAVQAVLGIFGGSGGPDQYSVTFTGSGLRIWGGWHVVNHVKEAPLFAGNRTIAMARHVYSIRDPDDDQMILI